MSKLINFDDGSKCLTDNPQQVVITPSGATQVEEIDLKDFDDQEIQQLRTNLRDEAMLNRTLQKHGKHISMKLDKEK